MIQIKLPPPDDAYVHTVCKIGHGHACCRYLVVGPNGWGCVKLEPPLCAILDKRVREETMVARGDNCPGRGSGD